MRVFKNKWFAKFARKERINDQKLAELIKDLEKGIIDADYGGGVVKQRLARVGQGKSGAYRCIILFRAHEKAFFTYGFLKSELDNIAKEDEQVFKELAERVLNFSDEEIKHLLNTGALIEVNYE